MSKRPNKVPLSPLTHHELLQRAEDATRRAGVEMRYAVTQPKHRSYYLRSAEAAAEQANEMDEAFDIRTGVKK